MDSPTMDTGTPDGTPETGRRQWVDVAPVAEVEKRKRVVVDGGIVTDGPDGDTTEPVLVIAHEGAFHAMANICVHRDRELAKGVVLKGRLICPGHQWAFDLNDGWESVKCRAQPTYTVRVEDGIVQVDLASRVVATRDTTD